MADTNHVHANPPVEGDGISYRGIVWFVVILAVTTVFCQALVWGMFKVMEYRAKSTDSGRFPLATNALTVPAPPNLLSMQIPGQQAVQQSVLGDADPGGLLSPDEAENLKAFRAKEDAALNNYAWVDKGTGVVEIPIDRAKALVLEHGFPTRPAAGSEKAAPAKTPTPVAPAAKKR